MWDVTPVSTLAESYVEAAARGPSEVTELAANLKADKYRNLAYQYIFLLITFETLETQTFQPATFCANLTDELVKFPLMTETTSFPSACLLYCSISTRVSSTTVSGANKYSHYGLFTTPKNST